MSGFQVFGLSPHQIYEYFATGRGTEKLDDARDASRKEWDLEEDRAQLIRKQGELIRGGWQGAASEGAFGAAQPLAESALHGADLLSRSEDLLDRQSGSFHRTKNSVRPVPPAPPQMDPMDFTLPFSDYEKDVKAYQADAQHNIDVYRGYDGASEYNEKNMPREYTTVNHAGGNVSVTAGDDRRTSTTGDYITVPDYVPPRGGDESGQRRDPGGVPVGGPPISGPQQPQQTSPSDVTPPPVDPSGFRPPFAPQPAPGQTPGGLVAGLPVGGFTGSGPGGPGAGGGPYGGPGARGGPGAGGPGAGVRGGVPGAGPGAGALAAEEAAARRAAGAAASGRGAGPGVLGGVPAGAGRGQGDEDTEHQRKVLIEIDAEGTFGSDVLTAPQVIGDDEYEDD